MEWFIEEAIKQARKEGNKGVEGICGDWGNNARINKLINEGKLEVFSQKYDIGDGFGTCLLLRKP